MSGNCTSGPRRSATAAETCDHQPFIAKAPYLLMFVADYQRWFDYYTYCEVERRSRELDLPYRTHVPTRKSRERRPGELFSQVYGRFFYRVEPLGERDAKKLGVEEHRVCPFCQTRAFGWK